MKRNLHRVFALILICGTQSAWAAEAPAEGGGGGSILQLLGLEWKAVLVQIIGFLILLWVMKRFLFGPLQSALANRRTEIQSVYDRIDEQERSLNLRRQELETRLASVESEARDRITQAVNEGKVIQEQIIAEARTQHDRIVEDGRRMIVTEQQRAFAMLREEMAGLAVRAATQIIGENMNNDRNNRMVSEFINRMES